MLLGITYSIHEKNTNMVYYIWIMFRFIFKQLAFLGKNIDKNYLQNLSKKTPIFIACIECVK